MTADELRAIRERFEEFDCSESPEHRADFEALSTEVERLTDSAAMSTRAGYEASEEARALRAEVERLRVENGCFCPHCHLWGYEYETKEDFAAHPCTSTCSPRTCDR